MRITIPILLIVFLGFACTNTSNSEKDKATTDEPNTEVIDYVNATLEDGSTLEEVVPEKITSLVFKDKGENPVPVYETFDEIEHIFKVENDTTYIINFWATWCKPCVAELPYFEQIHKNYQNEKVKVVLVSLDFKELIGHKLVPFMQKNKLESSVVLLADGRASKWIDRVDTSWEGAIPVTLIYKSDKKKFIDHEVQDYQELDFHLNEVLKG